MADTFIPVSDDLAAGQGKVQQTLIDDGQATRTIQPPSTEMENRQAVTTANIQIMSPDAVSSDSTPIPATGSHSQSQPAPTSQNNAQPLSSSISPSQLPLPPSLPNLKRRPSTSRQYTEDFDPNTHDQLYASIPDQLRQGTVMLKISAKKTQRRMVRLKAEAGQVVWESKHAGMLNIENIRELRFAAEARGFREQFRIAPDCESRWLSIIYTCSGKYKILHLVALSSDIYELWRSTLLKLYEQRKELQMGGLDQVRKRQNIWLKQHYSNADLDNDKILDFRDVTALVKNLNISASDKDMKINFERADSKKRGYLDFADFQLFVKYLRRRPEVEAIMRNVSGSLDSMSLEQFKHFLREIQRSNLQDPAIETLYKKFSEAGPDSRTMTIEGFTSFLLSSDNMAMDERQLTICDDMTRPLCEYYVSSSHNTYLVGGQLKGESTAEGYIRALQQGCRSVELDVWDGPDEPVIYHGRTLTSKLPAREALAAIGKYAFIASPFPLILSMEVHCDQIQQDKLAEILKSTLGKSLIDSPLFGEGVMEEHANCPIVDILPSPEKLKYRILVKAKNLYVVKAAAKPGEKIDVDKESEESSSASSDSDLKKIFSSAMRLMRRESNATPPTSSPPPPPGQKSGSYFTSSTPGVPISPNKSGFSGGPTGPAPAERQLPALEPAVSRDASTSISSGSSSSKRLSLSRLRSRSSETSTSTLKNSLDLEDKKKEKPLMSFALAGLIVYTVGVKWRGLNKKEQYGASHVISLGERRANKIIKEARNDLISHNRTHIIRSYPAGTRFTSSNYLPQYFWAAGVQLVALNWQTYDLGTEINAAFFERNGRSGYVLKPEILRMKRDGEKDKESLSKVEKYFLNIEILSAQQLPRPRESDWDEESASSGSSSGSSLGSEGSVGNPLARMLSGSSSSHSTVTAANDKPGNSVEKEKEVKNVAMNPYIEIAIHTPTVAPGDVYKFKTPMVHGNGFNPVFDSKFRIPFSVPPDMLDLAFLRLEVMVKFGGDELSLSKYTVSLPVLMPGYRHVPLYDHLGQQYLFSSLFICTHLERSQ